MRLRVAVSLVVIASVLYVGDGSTTTLSHPTRPVCIRSWNADASVSQRRALHAMRRALVVPEPRSTVRLVSRSGVKVTTFPAACMILFYRDDSSFKTIILRTQGTFHAGHVSQWLAFRRRVGDTPPGNAAVRSDGTIAGLG